MPKTPLLAAFSLQITLVFATAVMPESYRSGFVDRSGNEVIAPIFASAGSFSEGLAVIEVPLWGRVGVIDDHGLLVVPAEFSWIGSFSEGLAPARGPEGDVGYISRDGSWVIEPRFASGSTFSNGLAQVDIVREEPWALLSAWIDTSGAIVVGPLEYRNAGVFDQGVARVRSDRGWALIDREGKKIADGYDTILAAREGFIPVQKEQKWGFLDSEGTVAVALEYRGALPFSQGLAPVKHDRGWSFIDPSGKTIIAGPFDGALPFRNDLAPVRVRGRWGFVDRSGALVVEPSFDELGWHDEGLAPARVDDRWGFVDETGAFVIEPRFHSVDSFSDGRARFTIRLPATHNLAAMEEEAAWVRSELRSHEMRDPNTLRSRLEDIERQLEMLEPAIPQSPNQNEALETLQRVASRSGITLRVTPLDDIEHEDYVERPLLLELDGTEPDRVSFIERSDRLARLVGPFEELESNATSARMRASIYWVPALEDPAVRRCQRVTVTSEFTDTEVAASRTLDQMCDRLDGLTEQRKAEVQLDRLYEQIATKTALFNDVNDMVAEPTLIDDLDLDADVDTLIDELLGVEDPDGPPPR